MASRSKLQVPKPPKPVKHSEAAPAVVQAAQIALIAMKIAGTPTWEKFCAEDVAVLRKKITLTQEQQGLLEDHRRILPHLQLAPLVTVAGCGKCGRYGLATSAVVPAKCGYTLRCDGTVSKASTVDFRSRAKKAAD